MTHPKDVAVPSLPEPARIREVGRFQERNFTANQMRAYAREAILVDRAAGRAAAEPEGGKSLSATVADSLRPYLSEGERVIWQEPFRWKDDNGVMPNHFESMSLDDLAADFGYTVVHDCGCAGIIRAATPIPTASIAPKTEPATGDDLAIYQSIADNYSGAAPKVSGEPKGHWCYYEHGGSYCPTCDAAHVAQAATPELSTASIAEQFTYGVAQAAAGAECAGDPGECSFNGACMYACGTAETEATKALPDALRVALENLDSTEAVGPTTSAVLEAAQRWYLDAVRRPALLAQFQAERRRIITREDALIGRLPPRPEADADRASGGGV